MNNSTKERKFLADNALLFFHPQVYDFLIGKTTVWGRENNKGDPGITLLYLSAPGIRFVIRIGFAELFAEWKEFVRSVSYSVKYVWPNIIRIRIR